MRPALAFLLVLSGPCLAADAGPRLWKRFELDASGAMAWSDSLTYDAAGKLLGEVRKGPDNLPLYSTQYLFDDSGRGHKTVKLSPDGAVLEEATCVYAGQRLRSWLRTADNVIMDGITMSADSEPLRTVHAQVALQTFRFALDARGRALRVSHFGGAGGGVSASARFGFDARGRHVATYFLGPDSLPIGRDTLLLGKHGRLRELRRFDARGKRVATVERDHGPRGEIIRKSFKDSRGQALVEVALAYLGADSLAALNRSASVWKGPARTAPCELEWFRNVDLGIESATLYGLTQLIRPPEPRNAEAEANTWHDRLDREREYAERWRAAFLDSLGACRERGKAACLGRAQADLDTLLRSDAKPWTWRDAADSAMGLILELGGDAAYRSLLGRVRGDTSSILVDRIYLERLLRYRLSRAYDAFCAAPPRGRGLDLRERQRVGDVHDKVPEAFRADVVYRRSLQDAFRERPDTAARSEADTGTERWTYPGLYRHIAAYLRTGARKSLDSIRGYAWGGWCGTGSEALHGPKGDALLIESLVDGDFAAVLRGTQDARRFRQLLLCRGLDWEAYFLGGVMDPGSDVQMASLAVLSESGSIGALRKLFALEQPDPMDTYPGWIEAMATLLLPPGERLFPEARTRYGGPDFVRDPGAPALPPDLRDRILRRFLATVERDPYKVDLRLLVHLFARIDFPAREASLKLLATVPHHESRKLALQALGAAAPDTASLPSLQPVVFAFASSGKPFPYAPLNLGTPCAPGAETCSRASSTSVSGGYHSLSRLDYLSFWRDAKAVRLFNDYAGSENTLEQPLYDVVVPLAESPGDTVRVDIPLYRVAFALGFPGGFRPGQETRMSVTIESLAAGALRGVYPTAIGLRDELVFSRLGKGTYRFTLAIPGLEPWDSGPVKVNGNASHRVRLEAADPGRRP